LPTPENCSFLGRSQTWLWNRTKTRLCCHGTREYLLPICPKSYRSISLPYSAGVPLGNRRANTMDALLWISDGCILSELENY
jgi:hypothetical protein